MSRENPLYVSRNWYTSEWDCYKRSENEFAWSSEDGHLCTDDERTAELFEILDLLRDQNPDWQINTTNAGYKSGFRTVEVNFEVGGEEGSYHTKGCAADICISTEDATDEELANKVLFVASFLGFSDELGIGYYKDWIHIDTRGYSSRW